MQVSKILLVLCALALVPVLVVSAVDTPAQAAARAALEEKLNALNTQTPPAAVAQPTPVAKPAPVVQPAPAPVPPVAVVVAPKGEPLAAVGVKAPAANQNSASASAQSGDNPAQAAARAALLKELGTPTPPVAVTPALAVVEKTPPPAVKPVVAKPAPPANLNYLGKELGMKPLPTPALPIASSKEEQLQALFARYKADQISPEEYHQQRAKILAAP